MALDGRSLTFRGNASLGTARSQNYNGQMVPSVATIGLTNGARLNILGEAQLGYRFNENNDETVRSRADITIDGSSQFNVGSNLRISGQSSSGGTLTYNMNLAQTPTDGSVTYGGSLYVANNNRDKVSLTFSAAPGSAAGTVIQSRGDINVGWSGWGASGSLTLDGVGIDTIGRGYFAGNNGDNDHQNSATITLANGAYLGFRDESYLRNSGGASALLQSSGSAPVTYDGGNNFHMNGRVLANGGLMNVDFGRLYVDQGIQQADNTQAGWYARSGGILELKTLQFKGGDSITWGANPDSGSPDLVNSVRLSNMTSPSYGGLNGAVIDPSLATGLTNAVGLWNFQRTWTATNDVSGTFNFGQATLQFHYDNVAAGGNEADLKLFRLTGGSWVDTGASLDTGSHTLTLNNAAAFGSGAQFAVATAGAAGSGVVGIAPYIGARESIRTFATGNTVSWNAYTGAAQPAGWFNYNGNLNTGAPQGRDEAFIGNGKTAGATVTMSDSLAHKTGSLTIGAADNGGDPNSAQNWSKGVLNVGNASSLSVVNDLRIASYNDNTSNGTLNVDGFSTMYVGGSVRLADANNATGAIAVTQFSQFNVGGDVVFGRGSKTFSIDGTSQFNMVGSGRLYLDSGAYNLPLTNTAFGGMFSVTPTTSVELRPNYGNVSLTFDANNSGVVFSALQMGQGDTSNTSTLNVTNSTVTFGNVGLGSRNTTDNTGSSSASVVNVTSGGVFNIGGYVSAGGTANGSQTSGAFNIDSTSRINMTGGNQTLALKAGTYGLKFATTPTNGAFSLPAASPGNLAVNLYLANQVDNRTLTSTLNMTSGSAAVFNDLRIGWDGNSANSTGTLNVGANSTVTFNGNAQVGGKSAYGNQGQGVGAVSVGNGSTVSVAGGAWFGGGSALNLNTSGVFNVASGLALGGQGSATTVTLGSSSQLNVGSLYAADGDYSGLTIVNTPANGKVSMSAAGTLDVRAQGANSTVTLGAASNGLTFSRLQLGTSYDSNKTATLNVAGSTVTVSGNAELGSRTTTNNTNSSSASAVNVTSGGVLNIGGYISAGGYASYNNQDNQTSGAFNIDSTSQINMTGGNQTLALKAGTYNVKLATTPTNGAFSVPVSSSANPGVNLFIANQVDNRTLTSTLNLAAGSAAVFNDLRMASEGNSQNSTAVLTLGAGSNLRFTGTNVAFGGERDWGHGSAYVRGQGTMTFDNTLSMGRAHVEANGGTLTLNYPALNKYGDNKDMLDGSRPGWFALNGGTLTLPSLSVNASSLNWGEVGTGALASNSWVNSLHLGNVAATSGSLNGSLGISLVDSSNGMVPTLSNAVGFWTFNPTALANLQSMNLSVRYDDSVQLVDGVSPGSLKLWYRNATTPWTQLSGVSIDTGSHLISGNYTGALNSTTQFAVATDAVSGSLFTGVATWTSNSNSAWGTAANWSDELGGHGVPGVSPQLPQTNRLAFDGTGTNTAVDLTGQQVNVRALTFSNRDYTLSNGEVTMGSSYGAAQINVNSGSQAIGSMVHLATATDANVAAGAALEIAGWVDGASPLNKNGAGTLTLSNLNLSTGGTVLNAGTLQVADDGSLGDASAALTFNGGTFKPSAAMDVARPVVVNTAGGTFNSNGFNQTISGPMSGSGTLTKTGAGALAITNAANTQTGPIAVSAGSVVGSASSLSMPIAVASGTGVTFNQTADGTYGKVLSGAGTFTKTGTGTLTLAGANTLTGPTLVTQGVITFQVAAPVAGMAAWFAADSG
ncbi:MAG: hypothetical protein EBR23_02720, partial [Planctomycetia bacterium]|nr:hypothetical protein [Planctomycetia bacterium]